MEGSLSKELQPPRFSIKRWTKPWYVSDIPRIKNGCFDHPGWYDFLEKVPLGVMQSTFRVCKEVQELWS